MRPMPSLRAIRAALESEGDAWAAAIAAGAWRRGSLLLKRDGGTSVHRARILGREVVVKVWELGPKARLQAALGDTHALRHWRGAARLRKAGIATAWTWALLRGRLEGRSVEVLVMEALHGKTVLQHLADDDLSVRDQHALARAVGRYIVTMERHNLFNRDSKPSNLIATPDAGGEPVVAVIDCVAIRRFRHSYGPLAMLLFRRGLRRIPSNRMLASLVIEPLGSGLLPRRALMMRVLRALPDIAPAGRDLWCRVRRSQWTEVSTMVQAHGDPTPRVNPLSSS